MKNFDEFVEYLNTNKDEILARIENNTEQFISDDASGNPLLYTTSYTRATVMQVLKHYHEWLNRES